MDPGLVKPFLIATKRVFDEILADPCTAHKPVAQKVLPGATKYVDAIIHLDGEAKGFMAWRFPWPTARAAAEALAVPGFHDPSTAIGQIARMAAKIARRSFLSRKIEISKPIVETVLHNDALLIEQRSWVVVPFSANLGTFVFAVSVNPRQRPTPVLGAVHTPQVSSREGNRVWTKPAL